MSDMVGRVAKAIRSSMETSGFVSLQANGPNGEVACKQFFDVLAMDAIEAMREPTEEMCLAAEWHQQSDVNRYHRAIDAALAKQDQ